MSEYINRKILVDLVLSKLRFMGDARIMNQNDEKVLSEIDGYEKAINDVHELILDKDLIENVQPVKYGRWFECYTDTHIYSVCAACKSVSVRLLKAAPYEFCPRCGARMDSTSEKNCERNGARKE